MTVDDPAHVSADELPDIGRSLELLAAFQAGDAASLGRLMERYKPRLTSILRIRMGGHLSACTELDDIYQDVCIEALEDLRDFAPRDHASVLKWLTRVSERQILRQLEYWGTQKRDRRRETPIDGDTSVPVPSPEPTPSREAASGELRALYDACVESLPEDQRRVVLLREYYGESWADVADDCDRTVGAVQQLHRRARLTIAKRMERFV